MGAPDVSYTSSEYVKSFSEIPTDFLDDLSSRFIINVPVEERSDLIRICFQVELAHWFYLDFYCEKVVNFKECSFKEFASQIFKHISFLQPYVKDITTVIQEWNRYKFSVPTFGGILLDESMTHVVLVQSYSSRSWGFPKGKINKGEYPWQCAIREVYEETGFNIEKLINPEVYIEAKLNRTMVRLFIAFGVSRNEKFIPKCRKEIKNIAWFAVNELPTNKWESMLRSKVKLGAHSVYMIAPFVESLRNWITQHNDNKLKVNKNEDSDYPTSFHTENEKLTLPDLLNPVTENSLQTKNLQDSILSNNRYFKNFSFCKERIFEKVCQNEILDSDRINKNSTQTDVRKLKQLNALPEEHTTHLFNLPSSMEYNLVHNYKLHNIRTQFHKVPSQINSLKNSSVKKNIRFHHPVPYTKITLSESFLEIGITKFVNFKFNNETLLMN